jgi:hypothetical protein
MSRWLFVSGLSLDLAGAVLIAWTIYTRSVAETREEALTKFDANFWLVLFREREQSHVRAGISLLAAGFVLQIAGYLSQLHGWRLPALAVLAVGLFAIGLAIARNVVERQTPLRYANLASLPAGIGDERHAHNLEDLDAVRTWRRSFVTKMYGQEIVERSEQATLRINHGRWVFDCPVCRGSGLATPGLDTVVCLVTCRASYRCASPRSEKRSNGYCCSVRTSRTATGAARQSRNSGGRTSNMGAPVQTSPLSARGGRCSS